ncbi:MAG: family 20 glycosylhydrolase [Luteolibacter sp.]
MKNIAYLTLTLAATLAASAAEPLSLIPLPAVVQPGEGNFTFSEKTGIRYAPSLAGDAKLFAADLTKLTGKPTALATKATSPSTSEILLDIDPASDLPASGYRLEVTPNTVRIIGKDSAGAYYGTRTLLQLLPVSGLAGASAAVPAVRITDQPRFAWRGMMLDVGRHFHQVDDIKRLLDWMAFHKLNTFHWHLSEDQGWRIEIKKYPKLTEVGGFRDSTPPYGNRGGSDGTRYGGFYTQEQVKDVVAYAAARHITIVPEIDMPGHMAAAITAYPNLGNSDIQGYAPKVVTGWGVYPYTLAPTEEVFQFVDDVFTELSALFPGTYIHMGGDEAPKTQWENSPRVKELMKKEGLKNAHDVQSYFVKRVEKILEAKGKKLIGWDEIREGGLSPKAAVMSWRGEDGGIASAKEGHDVVMSPNAFMYFDHYQSPAGQELAKGKEYEAIGGLLPIDKVYSYNPIPASLTESEAKHILGVQANLWSEYFHDFKKVEYHAFPRMAALSEVAWTPPARKDYADFRQRLDGILKRYDAAGLHRGDVATPAVKKTKDGSTVETSLGQHEENWPELAFDGRADTFFWANRALKPDDHITVHLKAPLEKASSVTITTGGANGNGDRLEKGVLESSPDGNSWSEATTFENGKATGNVPAGTRHLRLRVTAPQTNWLMVSEITIQ